MYCFYAKMRMDMRMKNSDITKAYNPFRFFYEGVKVELINNPDTPIPTPGAEYGFHLSVVEHFLKVGSPLFISP